MLVVVIKTKLSERHFNKIAYDPCRPLFSTINYNSHVEGQLGKAQVLDHQKQIPKNVKLFFPFMYDQKLNFTDFYWILNFVILCFLWYFYYIQHHFCYTLLVLFFVWSFGWFWMDKKRYTNTYHNTVNNTYLGQNMPSKYITKFSNCLFYYLYIIILQLLSMFYIIPTMVCGSRSMTY